MSSPSARARKKKTGSAGNAVWTNITGALALAVIFAAWLQTRRDVLNLSARDALNVATVAADALLIVAPYWLLRGRWRLTVAIPVWLVPLYLLANVLYHRHFDEFIPFSSFFFTSNFDSLFFASVPHLFRTPDLIFIVAPALFTVWICIAGRRVASSPPLPLWERIALPAFSMAVFVWGQWRYTEAVGRIWEENEIPRPVGTILHFRYMGSHSPLMSLCYNGLAVHIPRSALFDLLTSRRTISYDHDQLAGIGEFIGESISLHRAPAHDFSGNRDKNLVVIVVESLNAWVVGHKVNGVEVTPALNKLVRANGTVSSTSVICQTGAGGSSDAQLLYNTGLLPLRDRAAAMIYPSHTYPSLASMLPGRVAVEVIGEPAKRWNHREMNRALGYSRLIDSDSLKARGLDPAVMGIDAAVMECAAREARSLPRPFFMTVTTLSMHMPFKEEASRHSIPEADLAGVKGALRNYLLSARYFDNCLAEFIASLKRHGLYDDTVIVIASDHNAATDDSGFETSTEYAPAEIVFAAANTGATVRISHPVGQVDVFPAILDIMGVGVTRGGWRGVGISLLDPANTSAIDRHGALHGVPSRGMEQYQRRAWDVSELIIAGDYFGKK